MATKKIKSTKMKKFDASVANMDELRIVVMDAFTFVNKLSVYIPVLLQESDHVTIIKAISMRMRQKLSRPTIYAALQILMRLSEYADETEDAYSEDRSPRIPRSRNHVDYTLQLMWVQWAKTIEAERTTAADWQEDDWNPYESITQALDDLITHIWAKHFQVKDL